jgi:hypothetical protein
MNGERPAMYLIRWYASALLRQHQGEARRWRSTATFS